MSDNHHYPTLPENADKMLFAEDFVNHILKRLQVSYQYRSGIADHRDNVYNAFNSGVRQAADYGYDHFGLNRYFEHIVKNNCDHPLEISDFLDFASDLESDERVNPTEEKGATLLMDTCVQMSILAGTFYKHGLLEAPERAVELIVRLIDTDMNEGGWNALTRVKNYRSLSVTGSVSERGTSDSSNSPEESVCSDSERIQQTCGKADDIVGSSDNASDSSLSGSSREKNYDAPSWDTSSDEESKQNIPNKKPKLKTCFNQKEFDSGSKTGEKDLSTVDYIDASGRQLNEEH